MLFIGPMQRLFSRYKIQAAFLSAITILLVAGYFSYRALIVSGASAGWVQHTYEVLDNLDQLATSIAVVEFEQSRVRAHRR